jgi:hypothetical protein
MQNVDSEGLGPADCRMKRGCAIDADDHRRRLHAHRADGRRGHGMPSGRIPTGDDGNSAGEPAQRALGLTGEVIIPGDGSSHA